MITLIATASLGLVCMLMEIFGQRKILFPLAIIALIGIGGYHVSQWGTTESFYNNMYQLDAFSILFSALFILLTVFVLVMARDQFEDEASHWSDYVAIILFTLTGALVLAGYNNLVMLFLGIEILSISLYVLAGSKRSQPESNEAGMKYFLMGSYASGFLLFGIALLYGATGSFDLMQISAVMPEVWETNNALVIGGVAMILVGMLFKVSAVPFHFWSPDVYQGSPALITLFMATVAKLAAMAALLRLMQLGLGMLHPELEILFTVVIVLTMSVGNILATAQSNFKRVLAYSGISHAGFLLIGVLCASRDTTLDMLYYSLVYGAANIAAFGVSLAVFKSTGREDFSAFNGLVRKRPFLAAALTISMLSLASIPPLGGFWAKYFMFAHAIEEGYLWITIVGIVNTLIGVYYYFKVIAAMLLEPSDGNPVAIRRSYLVVIFLSMAIIIGLGIFPGALQMALNL